MNEQQLFNKIGELSLKLEVYGELVRKLTNLTSKDILNKMQAINSKQLLKQFPSTDTVVIPLFPEVIHYKY